MEDGPAADLNRPNAKTDLAMGPNAQTAFEPFAPNEQATWNQDSRVYDHFGTKRVGTINW